MDEKEETLLIREDQPSFEELLSMVQNLQGEIEEMKTSLDTRSFGKEEYQDKDILITKGIISVGFQNDVLIISGIDDTYRMWAGNVDPASANFKVDKDGNITSVGGTITGALFRTAATGERIEIDTTNVNQIRFYNDTDLFGVIEVDEDTGSGYLKFGVVAGAGIEVGILMDVDIGASAYNAIQMSSNGGGFFSNGNASTGYNYIQGKTSDGTDMFFGIQTIATVDYLVTDLLPSSDPGIVGALYHTAGVVMVSL